MMQCRHQFLDSHADRALPQERETFLDEGPAPVFVYAEDSRASDELIALIRRLSALAEVWGRLSARGKTDWLRLEVGSSWA